MPTRRIFELIVVTAILMRPAFAMVSLWSTKTLQTQQPGTIMHGTAQITKVLTS